jgi:DNA-binding transcriptional MerR regulator
MKPPATRRRPGRSNSRSPPTDATDRSTRPAPDAVAGARPAADVEPRLRMRDLVRESGLPRETIHFYKLQGLLPEPVKTGRNTALYTQDHVERLRRIRELQERQFLPLKAIRAILEDTDEEGFTPDQEDLVRQVRATLAGWTSDQQRPTVAVAELVPTRVSRRELRELMDAGLITVHGSGPGARVSEDDAVILECWAQFKEAGLGPDQGVNPAELRLYDEAMERLIAREARLALRARAGAPAADLSRTVEQIGPVIGRLLGAMHRKRMRRFLAEVGSRGEASPE